MKKLFVIAAILATVSCATKSGEGLYKGYELPPYQIIKKSQNIEIRQYQKSLVAEVEVEGERKEAAKKGFWILARYIFGKNTPNTKINMTSPVNQQKVSKSVSIAMTSLVNQKVQENGKWIIQFGMPKNFTLQTLPKPEDKSIRFKTIKARKMVAIVFSGRWNSEIFEQNKEKLSRFIKENDLKTKGREILAYYDDPFTFPWNRRNEVIWEIE